MRPVVPSLAVVLALAACNEPPDGLAVSIGPDGAQTGHDLTVSIDTPATDPNGNDTVSYSYAWTVDDAKTEHDTETVPWTATRKGQTWRVVVTPADGKATGPSATAEITVANSPPTATVTIVPEAPTTEDRLELDVETDDPDNEVVQKSYAWFVDGTAASIREERVPPTYTAKGQVWEVVVTPGDGEGDGEPARHSVTIGNSPPSVGGATVSPSAPDRTTVAECLGQGWADADDDPEGYQVEWLVDGSSVATTHTLDVGPYARGSKIRCVLTPTDGDDLGESETSAEVTIVNTPPSVGEVVIGPDRPQAGTDITAELTDVVDLDGDEIVLEYSWRVNGDERSSETFLDGGRYVRSQKIVLVVTPRDTTDVGEPVVSNELISGNSLPVVDSVVLSPADPLTNDVVTATVVTDDADGDTVTVTYEWYVEGTKLTETSASLDGDGGFDKHDEIYVVVTPTDSETGVAVTSDSLFAANSPPPAPKLVFDPEEPAADEDVTCTIDAQDPDADTDTITYTFAWTVNGTAYTDATTTTTTGDTVPYGDRAEDDEWICSVTPNDGEDDGDTARRVLGNPPPIEVDYVGTVAKTALRGGTKPGTSYTEDCAAGSALVGVSADLTKSGGYFAELAPRCAELELTCDSSSCTVETGTITTGTYRGGSGTLVVDRDCDDGYVVTGFTGRAGWYMDQLVLRCHPIEIDFDGTEWTLSLGTSKDTTAVGGTGGSAMTRTDCTTGKVATQTTIRASTGQVDGFQLGCQDPELVFE